MKRQRTRTLARRRVELLNFRNLVKDCAQEPQLVECFNRAFGAQLRAPITALLDDRWPLQASEEERLALGCFIVFVHENIWTRLRRTAARGGWVHGRNRPAPGSFAH